MRSDDQLLTERFHELKGSFGFIKTELERQGSFDARSGQWQEFVAAWLKAP